MDKHTLKANGENKFSWETFNPKEFFAETDRIAKILAAKKEKNGEPN